MGMKQGRATELPHAFAQAALSCPDALLCLGFPSTVLSPHQVAKPRTQHPDTHKPRKPCSSPVNESLVSPI